MTELTQSYQDSLVRIGDELVIGDTNIIVKDLRNEDALVTFYEMDGAVHERWIKISILQRHKWYVVEALKGTHKIQ